jgi:hypothetical protein
MRLKWILTAGLISVGLSSMQAMAAGPAAQLSCTTASEAFSINLIGYDLDLETNSSSGSSAGSSLPVFTVETKLGPSFATLLKIFLDGQELPQCLASRSQDPGYRAIFKDVIFTSLQVIDKVPDNSGAASVPFVRIAMKMRQFSYDQAPAQ